MAKYAEELITEVRTRCGRTNDDILISESRVLDWLNEAQGDIVDNCPGLSCVDMISKSWDISHDTKRYSTADLTDINDDFTLGAAFITGVWFIDGNQSVKLTYLPIDQLDQQYPDLTSTDWNQGNTSVWTLRGSTSNGLVEIHPACVSADSTKKLQATGTWYAKDFTGVDSTEVSDLSNADQGLIYYALKESWAAIGEARGDSEAGKYEAKYNAWLDGYKQRNGLMPQWDSNLYGGEME
jgi:hypothetical protein